MLLPIAYPIQTPRRYFTDKDGRPLIGGKVKTFKAGSESDFAQTYRDAYRNASNQKIVKLDNAGSAFIYLFNAQRLEIYDKNNNFVERKFLPQTEYYSIFYDRYGKPLANGKVYTYDIASTIKKPSYQDAEQTIPNTNPIILDENGGAVICIAGAYRLRSYDVKNVFVADQDYKQENRFVLTSKTYNLYFDEEISTSFNVVNASRKDLVNLASMNEYTHISFSVSSATIRNASNTYSYTENISTNFSVTSAVLFTRNSTQQTDSIATSFSAQSASIRSVLIRHDMKYDSISTSFNVVGAKITS